MARARAPRSVASMKVVIVTWQGGGATPPAFGLARLLSGRGHAVRMLAPRAFALRVRAAGALHRPLPPEAEFDPARGRQVEDQPDFAEE
ncbi:MAG: hypothetical protein QOE28_1467, partial [Solirubrobacteraceae bacterium]|nr:hypothetical protein [Solirubrobacteraceae bacterium]